MRYYITSYWGGKKVTVFTSSLEKAKEIARTADNNSPAIIIRYVGSTADKGTRYSVEGGRLHYYWDFTPGETDPDKAVSVRKTKKARTTKTAKKTINTKTSDYGSPFLR